MPNIQVKLPNLTNFKAETVMDTMRHAAPTLGKQEQGLIRKRTPILTGALQQSISYLANPSQEILVKLYPSDGPQLAQWGRVYAPYQEGPPLGLDTHTSPAHQMFALTATMDTHPIYTWAEECVKRSILKMERR